MKYVLTILLFLFSFSATNAQSRYSGRAWNVAFVDTSNFPNTTLYYVNMDSLRSMLGGMWSTSNTTSTVRSFNSNFQPSTTRSSLVRYSVNISCALTLGGGQSGSVFLEYSADGSTGWVEAGRINNLNTGTLVVGVAITNAQTIQVTGLIPANYYVRLRSTGTATITYVSGQETLL